MRLFGSQERVDLLVKDNGHAEPDTEVGHEGERGQVLQVSYPAKHDHWDDQNSNPHLLLENNIESFTSNLREESGSLVA